MSVLTETISNFNKKLKPNSQLGYTTNLPDLETRRTCTINKRRNSNNHSLVKEKVFGREENRLLPKVKDSLNNSNIVINPLQSPHTQESSIYNTKIHKLNKHSCYSNFLTHENTRKNFTKHNNSVLRNRRGLGISQRNTKIDLDHSEIFRGKPENSNNPSINNESKIKESTIRSLNFSRKVEDKPSQQLPEMIMDNKQNMEINLSIALRDSDDLEASIANKSLKIQLEESIKETLSPIVESPKVFNKTANDTFRNRTKRTSKEEIKNDSINLEESKSYKVPIDDSYRLDIKKNKEQEAEKSKEKNKCFNVAKDDIVIIDSQSLSNSCVNIGDNDSRKEFQRIPNQSPFSDIIDKNIKKYLDNIKLNQIKIDHKLFSELEKDKKERITELIKSRCNPKSPEHPMRDSIINLSDSFVFDIEIVPRK